MSHFTRVKTQMTDAGLLTRALGDLGYAPRAWAIVRGYRGRTQTAEWVVQPGGAYDVGFIKDEAGHYHIVADWWGVKQASGLDEAGFLNPVLQRYAYHRVLEHAQAQGYQVLEEHVGADQTLKLSLRRWR